MTALAKDINVQIRGEGMLRDYLVADNVLIYKGAIVVVDTAGYARPARNTATDKVVGIAEARFDNTITGHAAGGRDVTGQRGVKVRSGIHANLLATATAAQASVLDTFYALDDQTIGAAINNGNVVGPVTEYVSSTRVWVWIPFNGAGGNVGQSPSGLISVAGQHVQVAASDTVVTGLSTVVAVVASFDTGPTVKQEFLAASIGDQAGTPAAGSILLKTYKPTAVNDVTPVAATDFSENLKINWIAYGTP